MKDIVEHFEACADAAYERMVQPDGRLKCECGNIFDADADGVFIDSNPYSMPVCPECGEKHIGRIVDVNALLKNKKEED